MINDPSLYGNIRIKLGKYGKCMLENSSFPYLEPFLQEYLQEYLF